GGSEMTETNPGPTSATENTPASESASRGEWPLYEDFVRGKRGLNHVHVGSLHAADDQMAVHHARDVYTRRNEGVSIWVVRSADVRPRARTRRTRCSPPAVTRSTVTRPSTTSPTMSPTCEEGREMTTERTPAGSQPTPAGDEPTINVEHDEAGTNVEHDTHDNAYSGLLVNDANWAFGTDFEDPLAGVDTTVPDGVAASDLGAYCLMLGDDALVLSQRISEWCARAPDLEEDIALANIALDLLGQARLLLARAAA